MFSIKKCALLLFVVFLLNGCLVVDNPFNGLPPGPWRAILLLEGDKEIPEKELGYFEVPKLKDEVVKSGELPFNFEVIYEENDLDKFHIEIINGEERIVIPSEDIIMGWDNRIGKDTITINFPLYESYIKGIYAENIIQGNWIVTTKDNYKIPFEAKFGQNHRFANLIAEEELNVAGKWEVTFGVETEDPFKAIGEFEQEGNKLTGTFMTETGDYRFLEGVVHGDNIFLSCFDGAHAFLFEAKIMEDGTLTGLFRSGSHYKVLWEGKRNPGFELSDPDKLTFLKEGYDTFNFKFRDTEGQYISLYDDNLKGKVKLVQIMGTWCPNCMDETKFLIDYLSKNVNDDLKVIALGFEKHDEIESLNHLRNFKKRLNIPYEVLYAGAPETSAAAESLPMLNHIMSYPTLIFIDKQNQVRKIHTGFAGPATSEYQGFVKEFEDTIEMLVSE